MEDKEKVNIYEKLMNIQNELKVPKNQYNSFGGYKYRSCEDILEAVKPICYKYKTVLTLSDDFAYSVDNRVFIKTTARLLDVENDDIIQNTAYAEIAKEKKGMDASQITGTASSYARKYALNGLFCIDDTKDADTDEYQKQTTPKESQKVTKLAPKTKIEATKSKANITDIDKPMNFGKYKDKTWIEVYSSDIGYLESLIANCKSEEGKEVYSGLVKKIADSFVTVADEEVEDLFGENKENE